MWRGGSLDMSNLPATPIHHPTVSVPPDLSRNCYWQQPDMGRASGSDGARQRVDARSSPLWTWWILETSVWNPRKEDQKTGNAEKSLYRRDTWTKGWGKVVLSSVMCLLSTVPTEVGRTDELKLSFSDSNRENKNLLSSPLCFFCPLELKSFTSKVS